MELPPDFFWGSEAWLGSRPRRKCCRSSARVGRRSCWTRAKEREFLSVLAETCNTTRACEAAGMSREGLFTSGKERGVQGRMGGDVGGSLPTAGVGADRADTERHREDHAAARRNRGPTAFRRVGNRAGARIRRYSGWCAGRRQPRRRFRSRALEALSMPKAGRRSVRSSPPFGSTD